MLSRKSVGSISGNHACGMGAVVRSKPTKVPGGKLAST